MTDTHYRIITCTRDEGCDWERFGDDEHVVARYATRDAAEAAAQIADAQLRERHRGQLLCGYGVRVLVDGEWIASDEVER